MSSDSRSKSARGVHQINWSELAARQSGVVSSAQLRALGWSAAQIRARVRNGLLHPVHPDVLAVGHRRIVPHARLLAALLTCGPDSFLSHRTAAAAWGLRSLNVRAIEVTRLSSSSLERRGLRLITHVKLAVELDGRSYHVAARDLEKDKFKDAKLLLLGISVLRITDRRLELEPGAVQRDVQALTT